MSLLKVTHLAAWRAHAGISQAELARRAGLARSTIESLESPTPPAGARYSTRKKLAAALGVAPNRILYPPPVRDEDT